MYKKILKGIIEKSIEWNESEQGRLRTFVTKLELERLADTDIVTFTGKLHIVNREVKEFHGYVSTNGFISYRFDGFEEYKTANYQF